MRFFRFCLFFLLWILVTLIFVWLKYKQLDKTKNPIKIEQKIECSLLIGLDRDICKFLNFEFPYTKEDIDQQLLKNGQSDSNTRLGLENNTRIEGLLIDYIKKDQYFVMLIGFDDNNESRFVVPIKIPMYAISDDQSKSVFLFEKHEDQDTTSKREVIRLKSEDEIASYLDRLKKHVVVLDFLDEENDKLTTMSSNQTDQKYLREIDNSVIVNRSLLREVYNEGIYNPRFDSFGYQIKKIKNENDFDNISLKEMPINISMIIFLNDHGL